MGSAAPGRTGAAEVTEATANVCCDTSGADSKRIAAIADLLVVWGIWLVWALSKTRRDGQLVSAAGGGY